MLGFAHVELSMYPFESVAWAWDELWAAVHARDPWLPGTLTRSGDTHSRWSDRDCLVTQICGWPFAALHQDDFDLVGAFSLTIPCATKNARYRSILLSQRDITTDQAAHTTAAANSADSLSGLVSLLNATVGPAATWPGELIYTGSHYESLKALQRGDADIACVDSWTLAFIEENEPGLVSELHRVGVGPEIPTPAIAARSGLETDRLRSLKDAFRDAIDEPEFQHAKAILRIDGFVELTVDDYLPTLELSAVRPA
jgi:ABC-type phosphate/phosphonate transport system substrate-binding protein